MLTQQRKASPATTSTAAVLSATTAARTPEPATEPMPAEAAPPAAATTTASASTMLTAAAPSVTAAPASLTAKAESDVPKTVAASAADAKSKPMAPAESKSTTKALSAPSATASNTTSVTSDDTKKNQKTHPVDDLDVKGIAAALVTGAKSYLRSSKVIDREYRAKSVLTFSIFLQNCLNKTESKIKNPIDTCTRETNNLNSQYSAKNIIEKYIVLILKAQKNNNSKGLYQKYIFNELRTKNILVDDLEKWLVKYHYSNPNELSKNISAVEARLATETNEISFILFSLSNELESITRLPVEQRNNARKNLQAYWNLCKQPLSDENLDYNKTWDSFRISAKQEIADDRIKTFDSMTSVSFKTQNPYHFDLDEIKDTIKKFQRLPAEISSIKILLLCWLPNIHNNLPLDEFFPNGDIFFSKFQSTVYDKIQQIKQGGELEDMVNVLYLQLIWVAYPKYGMSVLPAVVLFFNNLKEPSTNPVPVVLPTANAPPNEQKQFDPLATAVADPQAKVVVVYQTPADKSNQNPEGVVVVDDDNVRRLVAADSVPSESPLSYEVLFPDPACEIATQVVDETTKGISDLYDQTKHHLRFLHATLVTLVEKKSKLGKPALDIEKDRDVVTLRTAADAMTTKYFSLKVMLDDEKTVTPPPTLRK